jgi:hypothetical protein
MIIVAEAVVLLLSPAIVLGSLLYGRRVGEGSLRLSVRRVTLGLLVWGMGLTILDWTWLGQRLQLQLNMASIVLVVPNGLPLIKCSVLLCYLFVQMAGTENS